MVTLEQARTLDAVARTGSLSQAARELKKAHTAVIYSMKALEAETGLELLDRSGYRTRLTSAGTRLWKESAALLDAERQLQRVASSLKTGWEPKLSIVFDGVVPAVPILKLVLALKHSGSPTQVSLHTEFLTEVEATFQRTSAELMLTVLPPLDKSLICTEVTQLQTHLVSHRKHPLQDLSNPKKKNRDLAALLDHTFLTVHGSDTRLGLGTQMLEAQTFFHLSDFTIKKSALLAGIGFGWMPEYLIQKELKSGTLKPVLWSGSSQHMIPLWLAHRGANLGKAAQFCAQRLKKTHWERPESM